MPEMDGYEVSILTCLTLSQTTEKIREMPEFIGSECLIVAVSAYPRNALDQDKIYLFDEISKSLFVTLKLKNH